MGRLSYRSLQPSKENIQHFKKLNLVTFSTFDGNFYPPGSKPGFLIRIWIQGPFESGSNPDMDLDPQHWNGRNIVYVNLVIIP
jgi:hypothetical protein